MAQRASWIARLAVVASTSLLVAACSGEEPPDPDPAGPPTAASNLDPTRQPPAPPIDGATRGGVINARTKFELPSMDPSNAYYTSSNSILSGLVTRSLTQYVYDADRDEMVLIPDLATDLGTPNEDYTSWTFTLRDGIMFEDGTPVTADDVAFGIERSFDRKSFPLGASYSNDYFLRGDTYQGPYRSGTDYSGVVANGNRVTIKMERPFPDMPYYGAFPAMGPIPRGSNPRTYALHPMATGPYKFDDYEPGRSLTLVRNARWDPQTDPGRHQYPDEIHFSFASNQVSTDRAILDDRGDGQTTVDMDQPLPETLERALDERPELLAVGPNPCVFLIGLDSRKITDIQLRQAVGYALDYDSIATAAGEVGGLTSVPARTLLPSRNHSQSAYNPLTTEPGANDPDKSRELLKDAGYAVGEYSLQFAYNVNDPVMVALAKAYTTAFEAGGFKVEPYKVENPTQLDSVRADPNSPLNLRIGGWCSDWPSGAASIVPQMASDSGLTPNVSSFLSEPEIDAAIKRAAALPLIEQGEAWAALDRRIETTYYPYVVTRHGRCVLLYGSGIGGVHSDGVLSMPTWKDLYVLP